MSDGNIIIENLNIQNLTLVQYTFITIINYLEHYSFLNMSNSVINSLASSSSLPLIVDSSHQYLFVNIMNIFITQTMASSNSYYLFFINSQLDANLFHIWNCLLGSLNISTSTLSNNIADRIFFIENALILYVTSIICSTNLISDFTCFHIKNIFTIIIQFSMLINCVSSIKTPGIIIESIWDKIQNAQVHQWLFSKLL